jgi:hypothetical protein
MASLELELIKKEMQGLYTWIYLKMQTVDQDRIFGAIDDGHYYIVILECNDYTCNYANHS